MSTANDQLDEISLSTVPPVDHFVNVFSRSSSWYKAGEFLGASRVELNGIVKAHFNGTSEGTQRCLIEIYRCLERNGKSLSWESIISALRKMRNLELADRIHSEFADLKKPRPLIIQEVSSTMSTLIREYEELSKKFIILLGNVKSAFINATNLDINEVQEWLKHQYDLPKLPQDEATTDRVFDGVEGKCSVLIFHILKFLVKNFLEDKDLTLFRQLQEFEIAVSVFKSSDNTMKLASLMQSKLIKPTEDQTMTIKLSVLELWNEFTFMNFKKDINEILLSFYGIYTTPITLSRGGDGITLTITKHTSGSNSFALEGEKNTQSTTPDYDDPYFIKAISEGSGHLKAAVVVMHGPPGAGKTSVKRLLLGQPPLTPEEQNSTDIVERPIRTCKISNRDGEDILRDVDPENFIQMITESIKLETLKEDTSANDTVHHQGTSVHVSQNPTPSSHPYESSTTPPSTNDGAHSTKPEIGLEQPPSTPSDRVKINQRLKEFQKRLSDSKSSRDLFDSKWIITVDSGGQPQFADILPLLFQSEEAVYMVVIRLDHDLHTRHNSRYCLDGKLFELPETLELTPFQMIERACQIAETSKKRVIIIATHLDNHEERVEQFDGQLKELQIKYSRVFVPKDANHGKLIFPVNAMSSGPERLSYSDDLLHSLIALVGSFIEPKLVPLKWFVYELELEKESKSSYGVLGEPKCNSLGSEFDMNKNDIERSLNLFNKIAFHFYHPDTGLVLIDMVPLTKRLSALVKTSFIYPQCHPTDAPTRLKNCGLFQKKYLQIAFEDIKDSCLSEDDFLMITQHLQVIVPVKLPVKKDGKFCDDDEFFIPSALSVNPEAQTELSSTFESCVINWRNHIIPPGFFHTMMVHLLILTDEDNEQIYIIPNKECVHQSRERITFYRQHGGIVSFYNHQKYLSVHFTCGNGIELSDYTEVLGQVKKALLQVKERFSMTVFDPDIRFLCRCDGGSHPCLVNKARARCICPNDTTKVFPLTDEMKAILEQFHSNESATVEDHVQTIGHKRTSVEPPECVPQRRKQDIPLKDSFKVFFNLLRKKSARWNSIGRELGVDENYRDGLLMNPALPNNDDRLEKIIKKWLEKTEKAKQKSIFKDAMKTLEFVDVLSEYLLIEDDSYQ